MSHLDSFPYHHAVSHHARSFPSTNQQIQTRPSLFSPDHHDAVSASTKMAAEIMYARYPVGVDHLVSQNVGQNPVAYGPLFNGYPVTYSSCGARSSPMGYHVAGESKLKLSTLDSRCHDPAALPPVYDMMYSSLECHHHPGYRKNVTKETTGPLKAWLLDHRKNPYPTKAEKIMLAIITKMTLTQVSTWFANARRRLKKETSGSDCDANENEEDQRLPSPGNMNSDLDQSDDMYEVCVDDVSADENDDVSDRCGDVGREGFPNVTFSIKQNASTNIRGVKTIDALANENISQEPSEVINKNTSAPLSYSSHKENTSHTGVFSEIQSHNLQLHNKNSSRPSQTQSRGDDSGTRTHGKAIWSISNILGL